jgi:hypothetical protein
MKIAEDKVLGLMKYELSRVGKIVLNAGSEDAKLMREKRKAWKAAQKDAE